MIPKENKELQRLFISSLNEINCLYLPMYNFTFPQFLIGSGSWGIKKIFFKKLTDKKNVFIYINWTLLPTIGKLFEKIIKNRIMFHLESNLYFHSSQHGSRAGKSTITAIEDHQNKISTYAHTYNYWAIISLDIQGAFDNISWQKFIWNHHFYTITNLFKITILSFIHNGKIGLNLMNNASDWKNIYKDFHKV